MFSIFSVKFMTSKASTSPHRIILSNSFNAFTLTSKLRWYARISMSLAIVSSVMIDSPYCRISNKGDVF